MAVQVLGVKEYHRNCTDNLREGLNELGLTPPEVQPVVIESTSAMNTFAYKESRLNTPESETIYRHGRQQNVKFLHALPIFHRCLLSRCPAHQICR